MTASKYLDDLETQTDNGIMFSEGSWNEIETVAWKWK